MQCQPILCPADGEVKEAFSLPLAMQMRAQDILTSPPEPTRYPMEPQRDRPPNSTTWYTPTQCVN